MPINPALAIAGPYSATWDGSDIGCTENGWEFSEDVFLDPLRDDCHGDMVVDAIFRGAGVGLSGTLTEFNQVGVQKLIMFGSSATVTVAPHIGPYIVDSIGKLGLADGMAKALVLTPVVASALRAIYTVHLTMPATRRFNLSSRRRAVPVSFMCFPATATVPGGGVAANTLFTTTASV
jgi:hypothetical protein